MANLAYVRPFSGMSPPVNRQSGPLRERLWTLITLVGLFTGVHSPVHAEIFGIGKALAAYIANVWFFTSVNASVLLEVLCTAEALAAVVAEVKLRRIVTLLVSEEGTLRGKYPSTNVAGSTRHLVRLELRMHAPTVRGQLPSEEECTGAKLADERFVARMNVIVFLEVDGFTESLVTFVALER